MAKCWAIFFPPRIGSPFGIDRAIMSHSEHSRLSNNLKHYTWTSPMTITRSGQDSNTVPEFSASTGLNKPLGSHEVEKAS